MKRFEGIIVPLITPFTRTGEPDVGALAQLVTFQQERGVQGFYPCGSMGEGVSMRVSQRKQVAQAVVDHAHGKTAVIVHVGTLVLDDVLELAHHAQDIGADAVGVLTPFYYPTDETALTAYYSQITREVALPLFLYNVPAHTGYNLAAEVAGKIAEQVPRVVGIKDSSGDPLQFLRLLQVFPRNAAVLTGADTILLYALTLGAAGGVCGYANPFPELYVQLYHAFKNGNLARAKDLQFKVSALRSLLRTPYLQPVKEALKLRGIRAGFVRRPLRPMTQKEIQAFKTALTKLKLEEELKP